MNFFLSLLFSFFFFLEKKKKLISLLFAIHVFLAEEINQSIIIRFVKASVFKLQLRCSFLYLKCLCASVYVHVFMYVSLCMWFPLGSGSPVQ